MSLFRPDTAKDVLDMVHEEVLGLVVSYDQAGYVATPLPLIPVADDADRITAFIGHFARSNPHWERIQAVPRALITFLGPHGYISPSMVSSPGWGPTWNYRFAQFEVDIAFEPERGPEAICELADMLEGGAWDVSRMGPRFQAMVGHVIAFRASVVSSDARFKLGQDENPQTFSEIVEALGDSPLAAAMRHQSKG